MNNWDGWSVTIAAIRQDYLGAKPPQQIGELKELLHKMEATSTPVPKPLSSTQIRNETRLKFDEMSKDLEDMAGFGNSSSAAIPDEDNKMEANCISTAVPVPTATRGKIGKTDLERFSSLYDFTLGYKREGVEEEHFLHPPIQYRIAFAKYVIKQLESSTKWTMSVPQGSDEEDEEDPTEERETLLEKWYDGLEELSSRQVLSEPFYRLYQIKVAYCSGEGVVPVVALVAGREQEELVKILENESSFVADGTTGLVTWEASFQLLKWLSSQQGQSRLSPEGARWVLELGCGCGFLAVAVTKCVPFLEQYIATDGSLSALEKAKFNVDANFRKGKSDEMLRRKIRFEKVDWQEESRESFTQLVDAMTNIYGVGSGVLLGADIVFDQELIPHLVDLFTNFVEAGAGKVIVSCTIRNEETMQVLGKKLDSQQALDASVCGRWENGDILEICSS